MGESGSNPNPDEDLPSASRFPYEQTACGLSGYILIVEDSEADVFLIREAIETTKLAIAVRVAKDGEEAIRLFDEANSDAAGPCPELVILDINLPRKQGDEVLRYMRKGGRCGNTPVIAVSTSESARDREAMITLGANDYFHKPSAYDDFMKLGILIKTLLSRS